MSVAPTEQDRRRYETQIQARLLWGRIGRTDLQRFDEQVAVKTPTFVDPLVREFFTTTAASYRQMIEDEKSRTLSSERPLSYFPLKVKRLLDSINAILGADPEELREYLIWEAIEAKFSRATTEEERLRLGDIINRLSKESPKVDWDTEPLRLIEKTREKVEQIPGVKEKLDAVGFWTTKSTAVIEGMGQKLTLENVPDEMPDHPHRHVSLEWKVGSGDPDRSFFVHHLPKGRETDNIGQITWIAYLEPGVNFGNDWRAIVTIDKMLDSIPNIFAPTVTVTQE